MPYWMKPLPCAPARIKRMSKQLILSLCESTYGGSVAPKLHEASFVGAKPTPV